MQCSIGNTENIYIHRRAGFRGSQPDKAGVSRQLDQCSRILRGSYRRASDAQVSKRISRGGLSAFHHPDVATGAGFPDRFAVGDDKTGHPLDRGSL